MIWKVLLAVAVAVVAIVAGVLLLALAKPDIFRIERSITIQAPVDKVFPLINDLHNWPKWAPQDREDSTMKRTFSGADQGTGAVSEWSGSGNTGQGRMVITESVTGRRVAVQVDFAKPFVVQNVNEFTLEGQGSSTQVTWAMHGPNIYVLKVMSVFANMDRVMGKHFETGLANLKVAAEQ